MMWLPMMWHKAQSREARAGGKIWREVSLRTSRQKQDSMLTLKVVLAGK